MLARTIEFGSMLAGLVTLSTFQKNLLLSLPFPEHSMQRLNEIVDLYLQMDTEYALMVTGDWGVGKTYYFKHTLKDRISSTPVLGNNKKKYKPILVSLFGLKSVEEIQSEIFLSLFPFLKKSTIKLGASIGKAVAKGIMHLKGLGEYSKYVEEIDVNKNTLINFEEIVLCFDDLERISKSLNIEEFIGYVNSLVENENVKVLIIANEGKISDQSYSALKEKVVGNSIEFIADLNVVFDNILLSKYNAFSSYKSFLEKNKEFILETFQKASTNFRILIFVLNYFQLIYSEIINQLPSEKALKTKQDEILLMLLKFSLCIGTEYKNGKISYQNRQDLDSPQGIDYEALTAGSYFGRQNKKAKTEEEKSYKEKFIEKFYSADIFNYFPSVYNFITGGSNFIFKDLVIELKNQYHIVENKVSPQYEIFNQLNYSLVFSITDADYKRLTRSMLQHVDKGDYELSSYMSIFYFSARFGNPLKFNLNKLEKRIITGMLRGKANYKYIDMLPHYLSVSTDAEHKNHLLSIRTSALKLNEEIKNQFQVDDAKILERKCFSDFEEFSDKVLDRRKEQYYYTPIFQSFSAHKFYLFFINSDNHIRWRIISFINSRYYIPISNYLKLEIDFLETVKKKLEKKIMKIPKNGITNYIFIQFNKALKESIEGLNALT